MDVIHAAEVFQFYHASFGTLFFGLHDRKERSLCQSEKSQKINARPIHALYDAKVRIAIENDETPPKKPASLERKDDEDGFVFNKLLPNHQVIAPLA